MSIFSPLYFSLSLALGWSRLLPSPVDFRRNKETDFIAINFTVDAYRSYSFRIVDFQSVAIHSVRKVRCVFFFISLHIIFQLHPKSKKKEGMKKTICNVTTIPMDYIQIKEHTQFIDENEQQIYFFSFHLKLMCQHSHTLDDRRRRRRTRSMFWVTTSRKKNSLMFMHFAIQIGRIK